MDTPRKDKRPHTPVERHTTAAWADFEQSKPVSNVAIPSEHGTDNAKEYVDGNEK
jgi:hypothetical protein